MSEWDVLRIIAEVLGIGAAARVAVQVLLKRLIQLHSRLEDIDGRLDHIDKCLDDLRAETQRYLDLHEIQTEMDQDITWLKAKLGEPLVHRRRSRAREGP